MEKNPLPILKKLLVFILLFILFEESQAQIIDTVYSNSNLKYYSTTSKKNVLEFKNTVEHTLIINEFMPLNNVISDNFNEYDDWIEIYNYGDNAFDLNGYYITDNFSNPIKHKIEMGKDTNSLIIPPNGYIILWADGQPEQGNTHLSFCLSGDSEEIALFSPDFFLIDSVSYSIKPNVVSYGRINGEYLVWNYFENPTPGETNPDQGLLGELISPVVTPTGGFYSDTICVELTDLSNSDKIVYTIDGSEPEINSDEYTNPIEISSNAILRFRCYKEDYLPSEIISNTYIFDEISSIKVLSVIGSNKDLYESNGIFQNLKSGLEAPIHVEIFDNNCKSRFSFNAGIKSHTDNKSAQTPFRIYARAEYGIKEINYPLFENYDVNSFKRLVIRSGGNDRFGIDKNRVHFRDALIHVLAKTINPDIDISAYTPAHVYINGNYKGIYNIRERQDEHYISSHHNITEIDFLERCFNSPGNKNIINGSWENYDSIRNFISENDLTIKKNYDYIETQIDFSNLIDYWIHEIYVGNYDWLTNNIKYWRPVDGSGKWRFVLWDTDHGLGLPFDKYSNPNWNTVKWALGTEGDRSWSGNNNIIIRKLLENDEFKNTFILRFCDLLNSKYKPEFVQSITDSIASILRPEMPRQVEFTGTNMNKWENGIVNLKNYIEDRPEYLWLHLKDFFNLKDKQAIEIKIFPANTANIKVNSEIIEIENDTVIVNYIKGMTIDLEILPKPNYYFNKWENGDVNSKITLQVTNDTLIKAYLTTTYIDIIPIIFNEISYFNSSEKSAGQWIELYNNSNKKCNVSGYSLKNKQNNIYTIPENMYIDAGEYFIVCEDTLKFFSADFQVKNLTGNFEFTLDSISDHLYLLDTNNNEIDSLIYDLSKGWPIIKNGYTNTLELININLDRKVPTSWQYSYESEGTPGKINSKPNSEYFENLFINEIKTNGNHLISDEHGDFDDWIELYNQSDHLINIAGLFFTDNLSNPYKSIITYNSLLNTTIYPDSFLIVWADGEKHEGNLHLDFKLDPDGENLAMIYNNKDNYEIIDLISYYAQISDSSFGRFPDGSINLRFLNETPGFANIYLPPHVPSPITTTNYTVNPENIIIVPNPSNGIININGLPEELNNLSVEVFDLIGNCKLKQNQYNFNNNQILINLEYLPKGIYIIKIDTALPEKKQILKKVFIQ